MRFELTSKMPFLIAGFVACLASAALAVAAPTNSPDVIWRKFEELTKSESQKDKPKLDAFAEQLRAEDGAVAYLVSYAGRVSCRREALARASRVRNYLVSNGRIDSARIQIIDAGYHDDWVVELWIAPRLAPPLTKDMISKSDGHLPKN
jgi:hypothetical protein